MAAVRARAALAFLGIAIVFAGIVLETLGLIYPPTPFGLLPYGPVRFTVAFPAHPAAPREPILSGGVKGASYVLSVESAGPQQVRFVYQAWATEEHRSGPVDAIPGNRYQLTIDLPQLHAPTQEDGVPLSIVMNDREVMRETVPYFPLAIKSLWIGTNPYQGPYLGRDGGGVPPLPYAFSGQIRDVQRLGTQPAGLLADRLFPNLRYEVEIAPHIFYWAVLTGSLAAFFSVLAILPPGPQRREFIRAAGSFMTPLCIAALPLVPLLQISRTYRADWLNHGWLMEYYGHFLAAHHWFPRVVNTQQIAGLALPLFYGHYIYMIGGIFASVLGGDIAIRLMLFFALYCQTLCIRRAVRSLTGSLALANVSSALACWSIYPFSNLYGGSEMEFMAGCFLVSAVSILLCICLQNPAPLHWPSILEFAIFYALAASHPITGLFGGIFICAIAAATLAFTSARLPLLRSLAPAALLAAFLLSPWLYIVAHYGNDVFIARNFPVNGLKYYAFDTLLNRFIPFAYDAKSLFNGAVSETSYADMQLDLPLLLAALSGWFLVRAGKSHTAAGRTAFALLCLGWFCFAWALAASVSPAFTMPTASLTNRLQFAFRLINYQNLASLWVLLVWAWLYGKRGPRLRMAQRRFWVPAFCAALLSIGAISMLEKWTHGSVATQQTAIGHSSARALIVPYTFYATLDYVGLEADVTGSNAPKQPVAFHVADGPRFGEVEPAQVTLPAAQLVLLNASPLPVNHIYVDGVAVPDDRLFRNVATGAVQMSAGAHRIEYRFEPGFLWSFLRTATEVGFLAMILVCLYMESPLRPNSRDTIPYTI